MDSNLAIPFDLTGETNRKFGVAGIKVDDLGETIMGDKQTEQTPVVHPYSSDLKTPHPIVHKSAEAALLKAGALQSAICNSANFSSIATDEKGVIQIFNVGAERMLGYAAGDDGKGVKP